MPEAIHGHAFNREFHVLHIYAEMQYLAKASSEFGSVSCDKDINIESGEAVSNDSGLLRETM